jgi:hypothetical protein
MAEGSHQKEIGKDPPPPFMPNKQCSLPFAELLDIYCRYFEIF